MNNIGKTLFKRKKKERNKLRKYTKYICEIKYIFSWRLEFDSMYLKQNLSYVV